MGQRQRQTKERIHSLRLSSPAGSAGALELGWTGPGVKWRSIKTKWDPIHPWACRLNVSINFLVWAIYPASFPPPTSFFSRFYFAF